MQSLFARPLVQVLVIGITLFILGVVGYVGIQRFLVPKNSDLQAPINQTAATTTIAQTTNATTAEALLTPTTPAPVTLTPKPVTPPAFQGDVLADVLVEKAGIVELGIPVAPGLRSLSGATLYSGSTPLPSQIDNVSTDINGNVRWFMLSAQVGAAGKYTLKITSPVSGQIVVPQKIATTVTLGDGYSASSLDAELIGNWRSGPVALERILSAPLRKNGVNHPYLRARFYVSDYVNGARKASVLIEDGLSVPNKVSAAGYTYDLTIQNGSEVLSYKNVPHAAFTRFIKRVGDQPVFAQLVPKNWTGTPEDGTWKYFTDSRMIQNFSGNINKADTKVLFDGAPFAVTDAGSIGPFTRGQGAPGDNPDIGAHPYYYLAALRHFDAEQKRILTWVPDKRQEATLWYRSAQTGTIFRPDEGTDYTFDVVGKSEPSSIVPNQGLAGSHWGAMFYIPYLVTGDFAYLEGQVGQVFHIYMAAPSDIGTNRKDSHWSGTGIALHVLNFTGYYTDDFIGGKELRQVRSQAWGIRTDLHLAAMLPDRDVRTLLGWDKPLMRARLDAIGENLKKVYITENTGPGLRFTMEGPHFLPSSSNFGAPKGSYFKMWQFNRVVNQLGNGYELGVLPPAFAEVYFWLGHTTIGIATSPDTDLADLADRDLIAQVDLSNQPVKTFKQLNDATKGSPHGGREGDYFNDYWHTLALLKTQKAPGADLAWDRYQAVAKARGVTIENINFKQSVMPR